MKGLTIIATILLLIPIDLLKAQGHIENHPIREADVMWSMRVWRELDLRQKINHPIYYPIESSQGYSSLFDVMMEGIRTGDITAYGTGPLGKDDELKTALTAEEVKALTHTIDSTWTPRLDGTGLELVIVEDSISSGQITRYQIKEDWIFDRNRSQMVVRIIGIAPVIESFTDDGVSRGYTNLFWISLEESRAILANAPVFIRHNDNQALNYDDIFAKRFFDGRVIKVSNVYDRSIQSYATGIDALLEGEAAQERIMQFESDLWSY